MFLLCCWCPLAVHIAVLQQCLLTFFFFKLISQYRISAHHIQDCRLIFQVPEFLGDGFHYYFVFLRGTGWFLSTVLNEWQLLHVSLLVGFCINMQCNNRIRRRKRKEKVGPNSDNGPNNIILICTVI